MMSTLCDWLTGAILGFAGPIKGDMDFVFICFPNVILANCIGLVVVVNVGFVVIIMICIGLVVVYVGLFEAVMLYVRLAVVCVGLVVVCVGLLKCGLN